MLIGTNLKFANSYNNRIILEVIRLHGPLSRAQISNLTELTAQTVTNITRKLLAEGLIIEDSRYKSGHGAPSILLKIRENAAYSIGIDFDKDHLTTVIINFSGKICHRKSVNIHFPPPDETISLMSNTVFEMIAKENIDMKLIWGVGIGLPGPLAISDESIVTNIVNPEALPGWENVPIVQELENRLGLPVVLENNASGAALGEYWYGDGKNMKSFFYVYFGAGLGGGVVINGQLYSGSNGNAGELGYFPTPVFMANGQKYEHDHLGGYFNIPLLLKKIKKLGYEVSTIDDLVTLFDEGNPVMKEWLDSASKNLAPLIQGVEYLIDPETIFFGGRLPESILQSLLEKLKHYLPDHRITRQVKRPNFKIASSGIDAAALGVASIPLYSSFAPQAKLLMKRRTNSLNTFDRIKIKNDK